jgi:predicted RecB family nuclease
VPGIGRARARKLARVGIISAERLASTDPRTVARILGHMTPKAATALTEHAVLVARGKT